MSKHWLRKIGYMDSSIRATQSISNQASHLLVGALSGMFESAVSLRVSISFYTSVFLELPTGYVADRIGHIKSVSVGYLLASLASIILFFSLNCQNSFQLSVGFLVISSFVSAGAMAFISGAYDAMLQDLIDYHIHIEKSDPGFRTKALLMSQQHGKEIVSFAPVIMLLILILSYRYGYNASFILWFPAALFLFFGAYLWGMAGKQKKDQKISHNENLIRKELSGVKQLLNVLKDMNKRDLKTFATLTILIVLLNFSMIHIHTYLMISEFREFDLMNSSLFEIIPIFIFAISFDLAHYIKGFIVPIVADKLDDKEILITSFVSLGVLTVVSILFYSIGYNLPSLIFYVLFFRMTVTLGQGVTVSNFLTRLPEEVRALALSVVSSMVMILYGAYSIYLTFIGTGIETADAILWEIVIISIIGFVVSFITRLSPVMDQSGQTTKELS